MSVAASTAGQGQNLSTGLQFLSFAWHRGNTAKLSASCKSGILRTRLRLVKISLNFRVKPFSVIPNFDGRHDAFLDDLTDEIGPLAGGLSFFELKRSETTRKLLVRLAKVMRTQPRSSRPPGDYPGKRLHELPDGLRKAAAIADCTRNDRGGSLHFPSCAPHGASRHLVDGTPCTRTGAFSHFYFVLLFVRLSRAPKCISARFSQTDLVPTG